MSEQNTQQQIVTQPLLDIGILDRLKSEIGQENLKRVFSLFLKDTKSANQELHRLYGLGKYNEVRALAYTLKTTCEACGAVRSAHVAHHLGAACQLQDNPQQVEFWLQCLTQSLQDSVSAMDQQQI